MCACIAAGTRSNGGAFNGIAADARVISCRTHFYDSEPTLIYDYLYDLKNDETLTSVATNSFGVNAATAPQWRRGTLAAALDDALEAGIHVVSSAGNNHDHAGGDPVACAPNTIWLPPKSRADVMVVGACDLDGSHVALLEPRTRTVSGRPQHQSQARPSIRVAMPRSSAT